MFGLRSPAFENGGKFPQKYSEDNLTSPPLTWEGVPAGTKSFALAMTDPDVPEAFNFPRVFYHWILYDIPASVTGLAEGASPGGNLPAGAKELNTDFVTFQMPGYAAHYGGPWPPDAEHRYVFTLYALKAEKLDLPGTASHEDFAKAVLPQTIASTTLTGLYGPATKPLPGS
jgi:Raf kinase inhibitor-like YbhB/YbcL family protein